jgi:hypothetical protein
MDIGILRVLNVIKMCAKRYMGSTSEKGIIITVEAGRKRQKFGQGESQCKGKFVCFKCSQESHDGYTCENDYKCTNSGEPHMVSYKNCH